MSHVTAPSPPTLFFACLFIHVDVIFEFQLDHVFLVCTPLARYGGAFDGRPPAVAGHPPRGERAGGAGLPLGAARHRAHGRGLKSSTL